MYGGGATQLKVFQLCATQLLQLDKVVSHRHAFLASGRGTIKTSITYSVYVRVFSAETGEIVDWVKILETGRKADANKIFKIVSKHGLEGFRQIESMAKDLSEDFEELDALRDRELNRSGLKFGV